MTEKKRVLILCTGNSARSQMAEGILRHDSGDAFEVSSAGVKPSFVRPEAIQAMRFASGWRGSSRSADKVGPAHGFGRQTEKWKMAKENIEDAIFLSGRWPQKENIFRAPLQSSRDLGQNCPP